MPISVCLTQQLAFSIARCYYGVQKMKEGFFMEISILLAEQILKLFLILLPGFLLVKAGKLKASDSKYSSCRISCLHHTGL